MEPDFMQFLERLGVGGVLAALIFMVHRNDTKRYLEQWKGQSELLMTVVKDNTAAITKNTTVAESIHQHLIKENN